MVGMIVVVGATEGGDFDHFTAETDMDDSKAPADDARVTEQLTYLLGSGVGRNVEVLGHLAQQGIANTATDQISTEAGIMQAIEHLQGGFAEVLAGHGVLIAWNDTGGCRSSGGLMGAEECFEVRTRAL